MAGKEIDIGPVGRRVARNIEDARRAKGMRLTELSESLRFKGRPIPANGLARIESGERRVDVEDLFVIASALDVTVLELLNLTAAEQLLPEPHLYGDYSDEPEFYYKRLLRSSPAPDPGPDHLDPAAARSMANDLARVSVAALDLDGMRAFLATSGVPGEQLIDEIRRGMTAMTTLLTLADKALAEPEAGAS
jgi:transcriptional regulator with XRE-family HTH domain